MERMGHTSSRAALLYPHATKDRHRAIAAAFGAYTQEGPKTIRDGSASEQSGTQRAREGGEAS